MPLLNYVNENDENIDAPFVSFAPDEEIGNIHIHFGNDQFQKEYESQFLSYENNEYKIVFKGDIYNIEDIRQTLLPVDAYITESSSMLEIIITLYSQAKEELLNQLNGMFAFVIWDKENDKIFGARDPFGIQPLFYMEDENRTFISNEKKSILADIGEYELDKNALQHYMTYQFVPDSKTMAKEIKKIEPGHYFIKKAGMPLEIHCYWRAYFKPVHKSEDAFIKEIRSKLLDTVKLYMKSDVSVGAFLSGGIDSTFLASLAKEINPEIKTFTVGFEREGFSEIELAKDTAHHLGIENISYVITPEEYMNELPKIMWYMDAPLADPACVPLYFAAREARKHTKAVLSGEGADELFGGYNIYREPQSLEIFNKIPAVGKSLLKSIATILPDGVKGKSFIERGVTPMEDRYIGNAKMFSEDEKRNLLKKYNESIDFRDITKPLYEDTVDYDPVDRMQYIDIHTWMRGDILLKANRMAMAHSLEVRMPFLDKEIFKIASTIPSTFKTANGTTKYILRKAAEGIIPDQVLNRKKLGFPVPIRHWLRDEMYEWAVDIIDRSEVDHLINKAYVKKLLDAHCRGKMDHSRKIWTVLIFMVWHAVFVEKQYNFEKVRLH